MTPSRSTNANQQTTNAMTSASRWREALVGQGLTNDQRKPTRLGAVTRACALARTRAHACNANHRVGSRWWRCPVVAWAVRPGREWSLRLAETAVNIDWVCSAVRSGFWEATGRAPLGRGRREATRRTGLRLGPPVGPGRHFCAFGANPRAEVGRMNDDTEVTR